MAERKRIGFLCGNFDPVRACWIRTALSALDTGRADQVYVIPLADPSGVHCKASAEDRWRMVVSACAADRRLVPSRLSLDRGMLRPADLQDALKKENPKAKLFSIPCEGESSGFTVEALDIPVREYCACKGLFGLPGLEGSGPWIDSLFASLKPRRFAHSLSVAWTAARLASIHGIDRIRAEQAGLLHDCAKCLPMIEMRQIAVDQSLTDDPAFLENGALLHSLVGEAVARDRYGMKDPETLEAIRYHNTGHAGMSRLAMCVCLSDTIEPLRDSFPLLEQVRALAETSLERALLLSLEGTASYVRSRGLYLHPRTMDTIAWLKTLPAVTGTKNTGVMPASE